MSNDLTPPDPLESVAKGVASAIIDKSTDKIKFLLKKFVQKDLAFIEDDELIQIVNDNRKKPSFLEYKKYIGNQPLLKPIEMGLVLIELEKNGKKEEIGNLCSKINNRYGEKGVHIAELVQCGMFSRYFRILEDDAKSDVILQNNVESLLSDIEKYTVFVKNENKENTIFEKIKAKVYSNEPKAVLVFSKGACVKKAGKAIKRIQKILDGYYIETQFGKDDNRRFDFILRNDLDKNKVLN